MCESCGCSDPRGAVRAHDHHHDHGHEHNEIKIEQDVMSKNDRFADGNRQVFHKHGLAVVNMISSPGSGKTTLLERTITDLKKEISFAVIEGDQQTRNDAIRIRKTGVPVRQINTINACHLDAHQVGHAAEDFKLEEIDMLVIENVGNLVCPATFDLGEDFKIVLMSVTEGHDKPEKYPLAFNMSRIMLITKTDLAPYVDFDMNYAVDCAKSVNPAIEIISLSAKSGEGLDKWYGFLREIAKKK